MASETILAIALEYPPTPCYGTGRYAVGLHRALAEAGHRVEVVTTNPHGIGPSPPTGVHVHGLRHPPPVWHPDGVGDVVLRNTWLTTAALTVVRALPDGQTPSRILAHGWHASLAGVALAEATGAPLFPILHRTAPASAPGDRSPAHSYVAELEGWLAQAHRIVAPTATLGAEISTVFTTTREPMICPSGVWADEWQVRTHLPDFRALFARQDEPIALFAGRLSHDHGPDLLLEAVPHLPGNARLVVAGTGPLGESLRQRADQDRVRFAGHLDGAVLASLFRVADVLVAPHRYAPTCQAAREALACGLPVVASQTGALAEIPNVIHLDSTRPEELAAAVRQALEQTRPEPRPVPWTEAVETLMGVR